MVVDLAAKDCLNTVNVEFKRVYNLWNKLPTHNTFFSRWITNGCDN